MENKTPMTFSLDLDFTDHLRRCFDWDLHWSRMISSRMDTWLSSSSLVLRRNHQKDTIGGNQKMRNWQTEKQVTGDDDESNNRFLCFSAKIIFAALSKLFAFSGLSVAKSVLMSPSTGSDQFTAHDIPLHKWHDHFWTTRTFPVFQPIVPDLAWSGFDIGQTWNHWCGSQPIHFQNKENILILSDRRSKSERDLCFWTQPLDNYSRRLH